MISFQENINFVNDLIVVSFCIRIRLTDLGTKTVAKDLDTSDSDSESDPLDVIEEEPEEEFVNINLNNNSNGQDGTSDNTDDDNDDDGDVVDVHHHISESSDDIQFSERSRLRPNTANENNYSTIHQNVDLNLNNNGNGEDARKREKKLAERDCKTGSYPPPPEPFRSITSHLKWDSDADRDTEESDVDMTPSHDHHVREKTKQQKALLKLNPDCNGSYANPDGDIIISDEGLNKASKSGSGSCSYLSDNEVRNRRMQSEQGQSRHQDGRDLKVNSDCDPASCLHDMTDNAHHPLYNGNTNFSHRSELSVNVSAKQNYLTVNDNHVIGESKQDEGHHVGGGLSFNRAANKETRCDVPVIEITDTSRQGRGRNAKPILRKIQKQMTFDEDDIEYDIDNELTGFVSAQDSEYHKTNTGYDTMTNDKSKQRSYKTAELRGKSSKIPASKQDSAASNASGSSMDSGITKDGNPKSFSTFLEMVTSQKLPADGQEQNQDPNSHETSSVFQTGPMGLSVGVTMTRFTFFSSMRMRNNSIIGPSIIFGILYITSFHLAVSLLPSISS